MILDDEMLLGKSLSLCLTRADFSVIGPFTTAAQALESIASDVPEAAFLDVNLGGGTTSIEVARALHARGIPFALLTGYTMKNPAVEEFPMAPILSKPVSLRAVRQMAKDLLATANTALDH